MDVREKLVELILNADNDKNLGFYDLYDLTHERTGGAEYFADYLIAHGVTVQECKLGDKIYQTDGVRIYESIIGEITLTAKHTIFLTENIAFDERAIGNSVFSSYAEAEAHLLQQPAEDIGDGT